MKRVQHEEVELAGAGRGTGQAIAFIKVVEKLLVGYGAIGNLPVTKYLIKRGRGSPWQRCRRVRSGICVLNTMQRDGRELPPRW
jgi:hypothetical protein